MPRIVVTIDGPVTAAGLAAFYKDLQAGVRGGPVPPEIEIHAVAADPEGACDVP